MKILKSDTYSERHRIDYLLKRLIPHFTERQYSNLSLILGIVDKEYLIMYLPT